MEMLNEKELSLANGGTHAGYREAAEVVNRNMRRQAKWLEQEKRKLEGIAASRLQASENALKAAMQARHAEMEIKAAQHSAAGLE